MGTSTPYFSIRKTIPPDSGSKKAALEKQHCKMWAPENHDISRIFLISFHGVQVLRWKERKKSALAISATYNQHWIYFSFPFILQQSGCRQERNMHSHALLGTLQLVHNTLIILTTSYHRCRQITTFDMTKVKECKSTDWTVLKFGGQGSNAGNQGTGLL